MARIVWIDGCGPMACSNYSEVAAAFDRIYSAPEDQPLRIADAFAWLYAGASAGLRPEVAQPASTPDPLAAPGPCAEPDP